MIPKVDFANSLSVDVNVMHDMVVDSQEIEKIARKIALDHQIESLELSVAVVSDPQIRELNKQYLEHDYETDVLSFNLEPDSSKGCLSGEIIVSADTAARCAAEQSVTARDELLLYIVHGLLHLMGFDDKNPARRAEMREAERNYSQQFGIAYSCPDQQSAEDN